MVSRGTISSGSAAHAAPWRGRAALWLAALAAALLAATALPAQAHESEQYTLPAGRDFADLGPLLSRNFLAAIRAAVADTNTAIDAALAAGDRPAQVRWLQSTN